MRCVWQGGCLLSKGPTQSGMGRQPWNKAGGHTEGACGLRLPGTDQHCPGPVPMSFLFLPVWCRRLPLKVCIRDSRSLVSPISTPKDKLLCPQKEHQLSQAWQEKKANIFRGKGDGINYRVSSLIFCKDFMSSFFPACLLYISSVGQDNIFCPYIFANNMLGVPLGH